MKKFLRIAFLLAPTACLALVGCSPKSQAECFMDVSKHAQSDSAASVGVEACRQLFPDSPIAKPLPQNSSGQLPALKPGAVVNGFAYQGGDPGNEENWVKKDSVNGK